MSAKRLFGAAWAASLLLVAPGSAQPPHGVVTGTIPAAAAILRMEIARAIQDTLAATGGLPGPVRVARLQSAIQDAIGSNPVSMAAGQTILAGIAPGDFSDPPAVAQAIAEVRVQLSLRLNPRPTAQIIVRHSLGDTHAYWQPEEYRGALPPPSGQVQMDASAAPPTTVLPPTQLGPPVSAAPAPAGPIATPSALSNLQVQYNAPKVLPLGAKTDFRLIIASAHPITAADFADVPGQPRQRAVKSGLKIVKAEMHGPAGWVDIDVSGSPACQEVSSDSNPTWDWFVTPKTTQPLNLWVELDEVASCDQAAPVVDRVDSFSIPVTASLWQLIVFYAKSWQAVLIAIFALIASAGGAFSAWRWIGGTKGDKS